MSAAPRSTVSETERHVLRALWEHGAGSVREVHTRLKAAGLDWARSTVVTLLQRLEKKGYVESDKSEFAFRFRAAVSRDELLRLRMSELADDLCDGRWAPLLLAFTKREKFTAGELVELRQMMDELSAKLARKKSGGK
jgi:BlaI family transcriptional regulator, penicillinase repressor